MILLCRHYYRAEVEKSIENVENVVTAHALNEEDPLLEQYDLMKIMAHHFS